MARFRRIADTDRIFFVTTNLRRGVRPLNSIEMALFLKTLDAHRTAGRFHLLGYVVMPDHVHLLLAISDFGLAANLHALKRAAGFAILQHRKQTGTFWQPRFFDNVIRHVRKFWEKLEYIHNNPVEAGLVARPGDWKWSSYPAYAPNSDLAPTCVPPIPIDQVELPASGAAVLWPLHL
jgi:putative transposase